MYNTSFKVPTEKKIKTDWVMVCLWVVVTVAVCFAFAKAVDGPKHKASVVTKQMKG